MCPWERMSCLSASKCITFAKKWWIGCTWSNGQNFGHCLDITACLARPASPSLLLCLPARWINNSGQLKTLQSTIIWVQSSEDLMCPWVQTYIDDLEYIYRTLLCSFVFPGRNSRESRFLPGRQRLHFPMSLSHHAADFLMLPALSWEMSVWFWYLFLRFLVNTSWRKDVFNF